MGSRSKTKDISTGLSKLRKELDGDVTLLDDYEVEDENANIYELLTEEEFNARSKRLREDDFIEGEVPYGDDLDPLDDDLDDIEDQADRPDEKPGRQPQPNSIPQFFVEMASRDVMTSQPKKATQSEKEALAKLAKLEAEMDRETSSFAATAAHEPLPTPFPQQDLLALQSNLSAALMQATMATQHAADTSQHDQDRLDTGKYYVEEVAEDAEDLQDIETLVEGTLDPTITESFREVALEEKESTVSAEAQDEEEEGRRQTRTDDEKLEERLKEEVAFYLIDLCEGPDGNLHLFGRIRTTGHETESCMISVTNLFRTLFFKPRMDLTFTEEGDLTKKREEGTVTREHQAYATYLMKNFCKELDPINKRYGIRKVKYKPVRRKLLTYGPTREELYIKVCYSFKAPPYERQFHSGTFYEDVYHSKTSQIELFLVTHAHAQLKRKIKGPTWLRIRNLRKVTNRQSYCKVELEIDSYKDVELWLTKENEEIPVPKLTLMSISIKTVFSVPTQQEVFVVCCVYNKHNVDDAEIKDDNKQFIGIKKLQGHQWPKELKAFLEKRPYFRIFEQERGLLANFMSFLQNVDPDVIIGHDVSQNVVELLVKRCNTLNLPLRISLARMRLARRSNAPFLAGRLYCDTRMFTKELHPSRENYNLISCVTEFLKADGIVDPNYYSRNSFNVNEVKKLFSEDPEAIKHMLKLVQSNMLATIHALQLVFKLQVLPLTKELTTTAGNTWSRSLQCARWVQLTRRSERIDYLLMHEFYKNKYILDHTFEKNVYKDNYQGRTRTRADDDKTEGKKPNSYEGGLVFEPISGLYDNFILLLDFNSLYPSIIQEFNICFTTTYVVRGQSEAMEADGEEAAEKREVVILDNVGILPSILKRLVDMRVNIKNIIPHEKNELRKAQLKTRQLALKLIANSIYGCIGSMHSRFNCRYIASYITQQGRNLLKSTKEKVENVFNLQVIYGDTDSLMINTNIRDDGNAANYNAANQLALNLVGFINKSHKKLEIGIDAIFNRLLLLKKKKYASLKVVNYTEGEFTREIKGLDFIRRDWSLLTKEVGNKLLNVLLNSNYSNGVDGIVQEIHSTLQTLNQQLDNNEIPLHKYLITKQLTKSPKEYVDVQNVPHVAVAMRLNERGVANYTAGHEVSYIICTKESAREHFKSAEGEKTTHREDTLSNRAFNINEVKEHELKVDVNYYKTQQLLPPVIRLCSIIEGTDAQRLSKCLQVETMYGNLGGNTSDTAQEQEYRVLGLIKRSAETYRDIEMNTRLMCQHCNGPVLPSFFLKVRARNAQYFKCNHCLKWLPLQLLRNWVDRALYEITMQSTFCIRVCNICNVTTLNVTMGNIDRCPQPTCQSSDSMQNVLPSSKVYLYFDYLVYMLEGALEDPSAELNDATREGGREAANTLVNIVIDFDGRMSVLEGEPFREPKTLDEVIDHVTRGNTLRASSALRMCASHIIGTMEALPFLTYYTLDYAREREVLCNRVKTLQHKNAYSVVNLADLFGVFRVDGRSGPHTHKP